jgi:hypothetical protein
MSGASLRANGGRGGAEPAGDQPDAEGHLEQSTRASRDNAGASDTEHLQQGTPAEL